MKVLWAQTQTWGQWPADFALLSISWIVFFLESGSFLDTSTGWRQRTSPAWSNTPHRHKRIDRRRSELPPWSGAESRKASHGQRWASPGSPRGRRWRAAPPRCTRCRQRRWSGGPQPGSGPRCCRPGCPSPPRESPCRRSTPSPRPPSLSDTWTCSQELRLIHRVP